MKQVWNVSDFTGGLSLGSKSGLKGSYQTGTGIDTRLDPDGFSIARKMTKDSSTTVVDLVSHFDAVELSSTDHVYGIGDLGNVYRKKGGAAWELLHTHADA